MSWFKRLSLLCLLLPSLVSAAQINDVRLWTAPDHTRLVLDLDKAVEHSVFSLENPNRLVLDFKKTQISKSFDATVIQDHQLKALRYGKRPRGGLRVVLDLKRPVSPKTFLLKPNANYPHRLVVDLYTDAKVDTEPKVKKSSKDLTALRDVVVAIDAGHGGEDPGALGSVKRSREKDVTLAIAKKLKKMIDAQTGMRAILTRRGDYYLGLRKRMEVARRHKADLFVSIHADAFKNKSVRGSSVYVLSSRGASSETARWLAASENAADLAGGVSLNDKDDMLASVLIDLSMSASRHMSLAAAGKVYNQLNKLGKVHGKRVQKAGFMVLKSPDIPSMLIETGFISNPQEERNLTNSAHQKKIARAIMNGVRIYFKEAPPPGTLLAHSNLTERKYTISSGDTLSEIASRHAVSLNSLRDINGITNDRRIRVGQILDIPSS